MQNNCNLLLPVVIIIISQQIIIEDIHSFKCRQIHRSWKSIFIEPLIRNRSGIYKLLIISIYKLQHEIGDEVFRIYGAMIGNLSHLPGIFQCTVGPLHNMTNKILILPSV